MGSTHGVNTSNKPKPKNTTTAQPTLADASCVARRWSSPCSLACSAALGAALLALLLGALVPNTPSNAPGLLPGAGLFTVASCGGRQRPASAHPWRARVDEGASAGSHLAVRGSTDYAQRPHS